MKFFLISAITHFLFFGALFWTWPIHQETETSQNMRTIEMEFSAAPLGDARIAKTGKSQRRGKGNTFPNLRSLGMSLPFEEKSSGQDGLENSNDNSLDAGSRASAQSKLFEWIDRHVTYPDTFKEKRIEGVARGTVLLTPEGNFDESRSRIVSENLFLKVHAYKILRRAFQNGPPPNWRENPIRSFSVEMRLSITATAVEEIGRKEKDFRPGRHMSFYRAWYQSPLDFRFGPLVGGVSEEKCATCTVKHARLGVGIDVLWIVKKVGELISDDAKIDPLSSYKNDASWSR